MCSNKWSLIMVCDLCQFQFLIIFISKYAHAQNAKWRSIQINSYMYNQNVSYYFLRMATNQIHKIIVFESLAYKVTLFFEYFPKYIVKHKFLSISNQHSTTSRYLHQKVVFTICSFLQYKKIHAKIILTRNCCTS